MANDEWETPGWLIEHARRVFGEFELDVCATAQNKKAMLYLSKARQSGLADESPWDIKWWCNPPYSNIGPWCEKAKTAEAPGVMLLPCDHSTRWWQSGVEGHAIVIPIGKRVRFVGAKGSPTFHSVFALYGWRVKR